MELFTLLFRDLLAFVYHCFDRIVIYGHLSGLSRPEQVVHFFRNSLPRRMPGWSASPLSTKKSSASAPPITRLGWKPSPATIGADRVGREGGA
jgi:hypothetical protein